MYHLSEDEDFRKSIDNFFEELFQKVADGIRDDPDASERLKELFKKEK